MRKLTVFAAALVALVGCSPVNKGFVMREWSSNMLELGVYPIFPPREDIYVGDVFVNQSASATELEGGAEKRTPQFALRFARLDVTSLLDNQYKNRPDFPATGDAKPTSSIFTAPTYPARLKTVAFPGFLRATATGVEAAALVPVEGIPVGFAGQLNDVKSASVTVSAAESASVPWIELDKLLFRDDQLVVTANGETSSTAAVTLARLQRAAGRSAGAPIEVTVISEVFYARSFDVTMHVGRDAALAAKASLPGGGAISGGTGVQGHSVAGAIAPAAVAPASAPAAIAAASAPAAKPPTAEEAAAAAEANLASNLSNASARVPTAPGVSIGWTATATGDIGLRRIYEKPIAIGYRGVTYRVNPQTGSRDQSPPGPLQTQTPAVQPAAGGQALEGGGGIGQGMVPSPPGAK